MSNNIYIQLSIILISIILVLSCLIIYIVWQTLKIKKEYQRRNGGSDNKENRNKRKELNDDQLWIKRKAKDDHSVNDDPIEPNHGTMTRVQGDVELEPNGSHQMVTFSKKKQQQQQQQPTMQPKKPKKRFPTPPPPDYEMEIELQQTEPKQLDQTTELGIYCEPNH